MADRCEDGRCRYPGGFSALDHASRSSTPLPSTPTARAHWFARPICSRVLRCRRYGAPRGRMGMLVPGGPCGLPLGGGRTSASLASHGRRVGGPPWRPRQLDVACLCLILRQRWPRDWNRESNRCSAPGMLPLAVERFSHWKNASRIYGSGSTLQEFMLPGMAAARFLEQSSLRSGRLAT